MALTRITTGIIADNTLAVANIADNAVDATKIASNSILTRHIDDDQITGAQLADNIDIVGTLDVTGATTLDSTLGVTGVLSPTTHIDMPDDAYLKIGTGDDLQIYHSGTYNRNYIQATGSNHDLTIAGDEIALTNSAISETFATFVADGAVTLKYDNSTKLATASGGVTVTGNLETTSNLIVGANDNEEALLTIRYSTVPGYISSTYDGTSAITAFSTNQYNNDDASASVSSIVNSSYAAAAIKMYADTADSSIRFYTATLANTTPTEYMRVDHDGKVGIGTATPNRTLTVYGSSNGEMNLKNSSADFLIQQAGHNTSIGNSSGSGYIEVFTNNGSSPAIRMENGGDVRSNYTTDSGSNKRYTATLNPRIAQVGLQGYWDPTKPTPYSGNTVYDFSPSTHGNGNQDLTKESGVTHVVNSNRAVWGFDGTGNAGMYGNPNLSASKSCSFSLWVYYDNVNSLTSGYNLNGIQIGNHYMYIGIVQGSNDNASLYGYIGQGTNIVHASSGANENAYVNSDEWVYLTVQAGHGSSDITGRSNGRAEVYLNGALVTRVNSIALPTVAANGSSSFYLGRVQGGYQLDGYMGPAVLYERTLHQWEILENMRVHADMYMS